jgi:hypothetical protein
MKVLFIITSSDKGTWLSEVTHPYWHLTSSSIARPNSKRYIIYAAERRGIRDGGGRIDAAFQL